MPAAGTPRRVRSSTQAPQSGFLLRATEDLLFPSVDCELLGGRDQGPSFRTSPPMSVSKCLTGIPMALAKASFLAPSSVEEEHGHAAPGTLQSLFIMTLSRLWAISSQGPKGLGGFRIGPSALQVTCGWRSPGCSDRLSMRCAFAFV